MEVEYALDKNNLTEEEYGGGSELSSTEFLIYGLLTFWIYSVWVYHGAIRDHVNQRLLFFKKLLREDTLSMRLQDQLSHIIKDGFSITNRVRNIASSLLLITICLFLSNIVAQQLFAANLIKDKVFNLFKVYSSSFAAFLFCVASVWFLSWVFKSIRKHEYNELLLAKFVKQPEEFKTIRPSVSFTKRWNRIKSWIALFLIISIPMTISPAIAVFHVHGIIERGGNFTHSILLWSVIIFIILGVFHILGTKILVYMYDTHLRIETHNRQYLITNDPWLPEKASSVLQDETYRTTTTTSDDFVPKRELAAIMMTDMVGFSKHMASNEKATCSKLLKHNEMIRESVRANKGEEIKTIGDAFLVRFRSAVDAINAAIDIQRKFLKYNGALTVADQILIRIGIHIGDILVMDKDIFGNGVNIASRIEPLADPGGICISYDVYNIVKNSIDIKVLSLGKKKLKNIPDPPEVFKILD